MVTIIRPLNLGIIAITMMIFWFLLIVPAFSQVNVPLLLNTSSFFMFMSMIIIIAAGGYVFNDLQDVDTDQINKPNSSLSGRGLSSALTKRFYLGLNAIALAIALYLSFTTGSFNFMTICGGSILILWFYSKKLKSTILLGNVVVSLLIGLLPFIYHIVESRGFAEMKEIEFSFYSGIFSLVLGFTFFSFFANLIREIVKDCEDLEGDEKAGLVTIATALGYKKADSFCLALTVILFVLTALYFKLKNLGHYPIEQIVFPVLVFLPQIILFYLLANKERNKSKYKRISAYIKGMMLFGLIYLIIHLTNTYV